MSVTTCFSVRPHKPIRPCCEVVSRATDLSITNLEFFAGREHSRACNIDALATFEENGINASNNLVRAEMSSMDIEIIGWRDLPNAHYCAKPHTPLHEIQRHYVETRVRPSIPDDRVVFLMEDDNKMTVTPMHFPLKDVKLHP